MYMISRCPKHQKELFFFKETSTHRMFKCPDCDYTGEGMVRSDLPERYLQLETEISQLRNENCNLGFNLGYDEAILDGSWPQAVEILEKALKNAKLRVLRVSPPL